MSASRYIEVKGCNGCPKKVPGSTRFWCNGNNALKPKALPTRIEEMSGHDVLIWVGPIPDWCPLPKLEKEGTEL